MGLITKEVEVRLCSANINYFESLRYKIFRKENKYGNLTVPRGTKILVKIEDLSNCSSAKVEVKCDNCKLTLPLMQWKDYLVHVKSDGKYYCKKCASHLYGSENARKTKLLKGKSFYDWCIENNRYDILARWDYELNGCSPKEVSFATNKKYYFKCPIGIHKSELKSVNLFIQGREGVMNCNFCNSVGQLLEDKNLSHLWSEKNKKSPYNYTHRSTQNAWWKCNNGKHKDYPRSIDGSNKYDFRCPECGYSKGENRIADYLIINNIAYIPQKEFEGLIGLGRGLLSYDFYLPQYNLLIEYQGEQHESYIKGFHKSKNDFEKQQEHDRRKREYAQLNNIKLLEIWYWDFDNIEEILDDYFQQFIK